MDFALLNLWVCFPSRTEQPTNLYGESLRQQVEDRLKFYESGEQPRKNIDVMKEAMDLVSQETAQLSVSSEKKKKKKKRKADESTENGNGFDATMEELDATNGNGEAEENGGGEPKKKKKKKKSKEKVE